MTPLTVWELHMNSRPMPRSSRSAAPAPASDRTRTSHWPTPEVQARAVPDRLHPAGSAIVRMDYDFPAGPVSNSGEDKRREPVSYLESLAARGCVLSRRAAIG